MLARQLLNTHVSNKEQGAPGGTLCKTEDKFVSNRFGGYPQRRKNYRRKNRGRDSSVSEIETRYDSVTL